MEQEQVNNTPTPTQTIHFGDTETNEGEATQSTNETPPTDETTNGTSATGDNTNDAPTENQPSSGETPAKKASTDEHSEEATAPAEQPSKEEPAATKDAPLTAADIPTRPDPPQSPATPFSPKAPRRAKKSSTPKNSNKEKTTSKSQSNNKDKSQRKDNATSPADVDDDDDLDDKLEMLFKPFEAAVKQLTYFVKSFQQSYLNQDGIPIDLADKDGRAQDRQFMLEVQKKIDKAIKALPKSSRAEFVPEDKAELTKLNRNFKIAFYWVVTWLVVASIFTGIAISNIISYTHRSHELEQWYHHVGNDVTFSEDIRQQNPGLYELWYKGYWEKMDSHQRDSVMSTFQWKGWK